MDAVEAAYKLRRRELHENERPTALLTTVYANSQRDPKAKTIPLESYFMYQDEEASNKPGARYGAAAMALIKENKFPYWALFAYKDLAANAGKTTPDPICFQHEDAIILGPLVDGPTLSGMLIATEKAANKRLKMLDENGNQWVVDMPNIRSKVFATEDISLTYTRL